MFSLLTCFYLNLKASRVLLSGEGLDVMATDADNWTDNSLAILYLDRVTAIFNSDPLMGKIQVTE